MNLLAQLSSLTQGASNAVASNVSAPVDGISWLLRKAGLPIPAEPVGGSDWMARQGLTATPQNKLAGLLGETVGMVGPALVQNAAPKIAKGLLSLDDHAMEIARKGIESRMVNGGLLQPATVWHGSPHKFDKFDSSKIGTGEGKQQQGMGAYLAESPLVGQKYADKESWKRGMDSGYLYKVEIPDDLASSMANHDAVLADQPKSVLNAVLPMLGDAEKKALRDYHGWEDPLKAPFAAVMDAMEIAKGNNRTATSEALRKSGIPGIRYLDGGSRSAGGGTSNYVVFPGQEGLLQILERNGQALK